MLLSMQERSIRPGRPKGAKTSDPVVAEAFGSAVRAARTVRGISQEALAHLARIERSHVGKIERGEHMPTLSALLKIARALGTSGSQLVADAEAELPTGYLDR
jgi:XRE family transcriptional regulator, regulator of sulfur utilization